ncbi:hypothetical protein [Lutimonas sp.]|uniref:hypothetical protein n=1 Tax=Lutimonas sp. TaxID=1872403 RepID=UPI003D9B5D67
MKKNLIALFVCCICISFSSCDEDDVVGLLPSFKVDINQTENIPVSIEQTNGERHSFSEQSNLTIVNKDTEDYLNKIEKVEITKLSYKIINFNGDPVGDVSGSFSVANEVSLQNDFVVKTAADNQVVFEITEVNELNRIANALKSGKTIAMEYGGTALCDASAMNFVVEVTVVGKITIDP